MPEHAHFDNTYCALGAPYANPCSATPVSTPHWLAWNEKLAADIDWPPEWHHTDLALRALSGNTLLPGSDPVATVYAGHQFGGFNPQLGDGRALLLGEWVSGTPTARYPIKRARGPLLTHAVVMVDHPLVRWSGEYLISEAMFYLGVPTTRALAAIATGEPVIRNQIEPGAVLTRIASSHLRIGTVQYFAMTQGGEGLEAVSPLRCGATLCGPCRTRTLQLAHRPLQECCSAPWANALPASLRNGQSLGFIHGVLNTDNMLLCGETVDYGPCAFYGRV